MSQGNIADYVGRLVDVSLFQGVAEGRGNPLEMALLAVNEGGRAVAGTAKLAQRFFLEFMTEQGSIPQAPLRGSTFMYAARTGQLRTTSEAEQQFYLALDEITDNLIGEEEESIPDDEAFSAAELEEISLAAGYLTLRVRLTSVAGSSREVILPISIRAR